MDKQAIDDLFFGKLQTSVDKMSNARKILSPDYVEGTLMPLHEQYVSDLMAWRDNQMKVAGFAEAGMGRVPWIGGFGEAGMGRVTWIGGFGAVPRMPKIPTTKVSSVPQSVQSAFNQMYNAKVAEINAQYEATVQSLKRQLKSIEQDANAKIKQAQKIKDKNTVNQLKAAIAQAKQAYSQGVKDAAATKAQALKALSDSFAAMMNQAAGGTAALPPPSTTTTGSGDISQPVTSSGGAGGGGSGVYYPSQDGGYQPSPTDTATAGMDLGGFDWFDSLFGFLDSLFGGVAGTQPQAQSTQPGQTLLNPSPIVSGTVYPYDQSMAGTDELDVFDIDPWGQTGALGEFVTVFGNRTINKINNMPLVPRSSFGFSQWAALASGIIQAAGQVGSAAISASMAPKPGSTNNTQAALLQAQLAAAQSQNQKTDYTPWLIGGGVLAGVAVLVLATKKRK